MVKLDFRNKQNTDDKKNKTSKANDTKTESVPSKKKGKFVSSFKVGDTIVYPFHGVGTIRKKEVHPINGKNADYFLIDLKANKMSISIPIENAETNGMRHLTEKSELLKALSHLKDKPENTGVDWKLRQQLNNNLVKNGDLLSTIKVIVSLSSRNKEKELPLQERRLYDSSVAMLITEMSIVLNMSEDEAKTDLEKRLSRES